MPTGNTNGYRSRRREFVKGVGGTALGASVVGCIGDDNDDVTIEYWDTYNAQSDEARQSVEALIERFEDETGATVEVNFSAFGELVGPEWITAFEEEEYPVIFNADQIVLGQFEEGGWVLPFEEWSDRLDDEVHSGIEWLLPKIEPATQWMDTHPDMEHEVLTFPTGLAPQEPFQARMDHFEEAGLDPDTDFPPQDFEHLVEVAVALTEDGPGDYGFHLHGHDIDWYTFLDPYTMAEGHREDGSYFNEAYTDVNFNKESWRTALDGALELIHEHNVSGPETPSIGDIDVVDMLIDGRASMSVCEPMNHPIFLSRGEDLMEEGTLRWGEFWDQPSGVNNEMLSIGMGITRAPEGADEDEWEQKQELAIQFAEMWFSEEMQTSLFPEAGWIPVREDLWDEAADAMPFDDASRGLETLTAKAEKAPAIRPTHPMYIEITSDFRSYVQQGFAGDMTADEIATQGYEAEFPKLEDWWDARGVSI